MIIVQCKKGQKSIHRLYLVIQGEVDAVLSLVKRWFTPEYIINPSQTEVHAKIYFVNFQTKVTFPFGSIYNKQKECSLYM